MPEICPYSVFSKASAVDSVDLHSGSLAPPWNSATLAKVCADSDAPRNASGREILAIRIDVRNSDLGVARSSSVRNSSFSFLRSGGSQLRRFYHHIHRVPNVFRRNPHFGPRLLSYLNTSMRFLNILKPDLIFHFH